MQPIPPHAPRTCLSFLVRVGLVATLALFGCVVNPVPTPGTTGASTDDNAATDSGRAFEGSTDAGKTGADDAGATGVVDIDEAGPDDAVGDGVSADIGSGDDVSVDAGSADDTSVDAGSDDDVSVDAGSDDDLGQDVGADTSNDAGPGACATTSSSDLPGVKLEVAATPCEFTLAEAAAGIGIAWTVTIDAGTDAVFSLPQDAGGCQQPDSSGLIIFARLQGGGQNYCVCDTGLCMSPDETPVDLVAGTYEGTFSWDGKSWSGPSDTGNKKGPAFPAGTYELVLSAKGKRVVAGIQTPFEVRATRAVVLLP